MNYLRLIRDYLQGKKTYIIALGAIATAVGSYLNGSASVTDLVEAIFAALLSMTLRGAISKSS